MTHKKSLIELEQSGQYGSVVISNCGCNMSSTLIAQHFSFRYAPYLPLQGCTAEKCTCEYQGIIDRRIKNRRITNDSDPAKTENNRRKADRRK